MKVTVRYYCVIWVGWVMPHLCYLLCPDTPVAESDVTDIRDLARKSIQNLSIMSA
jgi:hypothetical protein